MFNKQWIVAALALFIMLRGSPPAAAQVYDYAYTRTWEARDQFALDEMTFGGSAGLDGRLEVGARVDESAPVGVRAVSAGGSSGRFYAVLEKAFHVSGAGSYSFVEEFRVTSVDVVADAGGLTAPARGAHAKIWIWAWPEFVCDGCTRSEQLHTVEMYRIACTGDTSCGWTTGNEFTLRQDGRLIQDAVGTFYLQIVLVAEVSANGKGAAEASSVVEVLSVDMF